MTSANSKADKERRTQSVEKFVDRIVRGMGRLGEALGLQPQLEPVPVRVRRPRNHNRS